MQRNIEYLQMLGLTTYQSKTMIVMLAKGPAPASVISKVADIPITKIYQVLQSLEDKELVSFVPGKPKLYKSLSPEDLFSKLLLKKQTALKALQSRKRNQISIIKQLDIPELVEETYAKVHPSLETEQYLSM